MKSVGCVGNLKDWLEKAYAMTLETDDKILTLDIIREAEHSNKTLIKLTKEAKVGEERLKDLPDDDLAALQGWTEMPVLPTSIAEGVASSVGKKATRVNKPGKRGPSRDPVGGLNG
jgi:hypothetical protein